MNAIPKEFIDAIAKYYGEEYRSNAIIDWSGTIPDENNAEVAAGFFFRAGIAYAVKRVTRVVTNEIGDPVHPGPCCGRVILRDIRDLCLVTK